MKSRVLIFFYMSACLILLLPIVNFIKQETWVIQEIKLEKLFNLDPITPIFSRLVLDFGVSVSPKQVVVGKDGWLFLGDRYSATVTSKREGGLSEHHSTVQRISDALELWNYYFESNGVRDFKILIGPDKSSIYPEMLPLWATPASYTKTDMLILEIENYYVDPRERLGSARKQHHEEVYFKTDTHWNSFGAWLGFDELIRNVSFSDDKLNYEMVASVKAVSQRKGGDLSKFLHLDNSLTDEAVSMNVSPKQTFNVSQIDFLSGEIKSIGENEIIGAPRKPLLVKSPSAFNNRRVLWLRDSFGTAMSPYMAMAFTDVLQIHHGYVSPDDLMSLVKEFNPEYVFVTVVERDLFNKFFQSAPPSN